MEYKPNVKSHRKRARAKSKFQEALTERDKVREKQIKRRADLVRMLGNK